MQNFQVVDISAWQEKLNWQKLKANNIQGVIIKIGEYTHLDEMFISHVNNAVTYNLPYGIYYYAHASPYDLTHEHLAFIKNKLVLFFYIPKF